MMKNSDDNSRSDSQGAAVPGHPDSGTEGSNLADSGLLQALIESVVDVIQIVDDSGVVRYVSPSCMQTLGYAPEEMVGKGTAAFMHPDDQASVARDLELLKESGESIQIENVRLRHKDGSWRTFEGVLRDCLTVPCVNGIVIDYHDITEYRNAEKALRESEAKYRALVEDIQDGVFIIQDNKMVFVNEAFANIVGYTAEQIVGMDFQSLVAPEDLEIVADRYRRRQAGEDLPREYEFRTLHKDGITRVMVNMSVGIITYNGKVASLGTVKDITERRRAEEQQRLLSSIVQQSSEGIALVDLHGKVLFANNAFAEMHGYTPEELLGQNLAIFHTSEQMLSVDAANRQIKETGEFKDEIWHVRKNGVVFPTLMHNTLLRDKSGNTIGMIGTMRDITERKQAQQALWKSELRYNDLARNIPGMIYRGRTDWSCELIYNSETIYGYTPKEITSPEMRWADIIHPDDRDRVFREALEISEEPGSIIQEYRIIAKDGVIRWVEDHKSSRFSGSGDYEGVDGVVFDITGRKQSEDDLRGKTEELRKKHDALTEKNIALRQVLEHIDSEKQTYQQQMSRDLEKALVPFLRKLKEEAPPTRISEFEALEITLDAILSKDLDDFERRYVRLTSRESEVCGMIKNGDSSKQISEDLNLSLLTVQKHREQIRKKLGITNKRISLATYLRSH
ncbi:MAG: hypothetical protein DRP45_04090 [Candidatus Zixiibacteriota bacterium]|nr:MAG: hypothetical protein DRP45_04090 [candidate division Zixibacteria bacterium]